MNTKKLKWLSKKAEDKQEFYDFINSYPKEIVEYVTDVCYKNRYISFHEFIYTAGLIFNFSEYRSTREQIMLAEKALELSSGPFSSYDLDRLRKINDVVISEYLLENCTFNNVQTATGHNSVIYNTNNYMYLTGCNITNCHTGYGAVTNYNSGSTTSVIMYVDDCKFINIC